MARSIAGTLLKVTISAAAVAGIGSIIIKRFQGRDDRIGHEVDRLVGWLNRMFGKRWVDTAVDKIYALTPERWKSLADVVLKIEQAAEGLWSSEEKRRRAVAQA